MIAENDAEDTAVAAVAESTASSDAASPPRAKSRLVHRISRGLRGRLLASVTAAMLVGLGASAGLLYHFQYQPDRQINSAANDAVLKAATDGSVAVLSYSPESLDRDFATAKSRLTGKFLSYYSDYTEKVVAPAARQRSVTTKASVVRAAVTDIHAESATVLLFINLITSSKDNPDGAFAASAVKVVMTKIGGAWLISAFDPL